MKYSLSLRPTLPGKFDTLKRENKKEWFTLTYSRDSQPFKKIPQFTVVKMSNQGNSLNLKHCCI